MIRMPSQFALIWLVFPKNPDQCEGQIDVNRVTSSLLCPSEGLILMMIWQIPIVGPILGH